MANTTRLLLSTAAAAALLAQPLAAQTSATDTGTDSGVIQLDPLTLFGWITSIVSGDTSNTGSTTLGAASVNARSDGSGDANTALTSLPTVQYRNDTDADAGTNIDNVLDLKPLELSISGGRTDENNFMIDGVGINSAVSESPFASTDLSRVTGSPNVYAIYGTHTQTQFVPSSMVEGVEVLDSNVSAEYGGFQGGVVNYKLKKASTAAASGEASISYQDQDFTRYHLGTEDGLNPLDVQKPTWRKRNLVFTHNQPIGDRTAVLFGFSRSYAEGPKTKDPELTVGAAKSESRSDFYRLELTHETSVGTFGLTANITDYSQDWDAAYSRDMQIDMKTLSKSLTASYDREFETLRFAGIQARNVKLDVDVTAQSNSADNDYNSNVMIQWVQRGRTGWEASLMDDWCQTITTGIAVTTCREGGYGDRAFDETRKKISAKLSGDVWKGRFSMGITSSRADVSRTYEGYSMYVASSSATVNSDSTLAGKSFSAFICPEGDEACNAEQYGRTRTSLQGYTLDVDATRTEAWLELDQKWGDFGLRGGARVSYNDVLKNWDVAPRLVANWTPTEALTLTLGANRYFSDNWITYAIHDGTLYPVASTRTHNPTTGVVGDWSTPAAQRQYSYLESGVDTPYTDELTIGAIYSDDWTGGTWRARYIQRDGKDQFARSVDSTTTVSTLTNDGWSKYDSVVLEYKKVWAMPQGGRLDQLGLYVSGVWADRQVSNNSYFGDEGIAGGTEYFWYNDTSYTLSEFGVVTGNMDIPVRSTIELRGSWDEGRFELGLGADVAFSYTGVIDTGDEINVPNGQGTVVSHYVWEDRKFDATVSVNLSARVRLAQIDGNPLNLDLKVSNLLDDTGNRMASTSNPWMQGRTFWVGTTYTW